MLFSVIVATIPNLIITGQTKNNMTRTHYLARLYRRFDLFMIAALCLAVPQLILLLSGDTFLSQSSDAQLHIDRTIAITTELKNGYFWPRWSHYLHGGYGSPIFNYYSPLVYILGGMLNLLTGLPHDLILSGVIVGIVFLRPLGAYLFARQFVDAPSALAGASLYTWMPFHFRELMIQVNIPQFMAIALIPFVLWALVRAIKNQSIGWYLFGAVLFAVVIVTHQLTAFLFAPVLIGVLTAYVMLFSTTRQQRIHDLTWAGLAVLLGLIVSAIYWLPALSELKLTQIDTIQDATFTIDKNYIDPAFLFAPITAIDQGWLNWQNYYGSFGPRAGQAHVIVLGLALVMIVFSRLARPLKALTFLSASLAIFSLLMITPLSSKIWDVLPLIGYIQFPWRFLIVFGIAIIVPAGLLVMGIPERWRMIGAGLVIGGVFLSVLPLFYAPITFTPAGEVSPADVLRRERETGNIATTASNEYLSRWATVAPLRVLNDEEMAVLQEGGWRIWLDESTLPDGASAVYQTDSPAGVSVYRVTSDQPFDLIFQQLYYPAWDVRLDGERLEEFPITDYGLVGVSLPAGVHDVSIRYGGTATQHTATLISLFGVILTLGGGVALIVRKRTPVNVSPSTDHMPSSRLALGVMGMMAIYGVVDAVWIRPHTDLFRTHHPPTAPPAEQIVHIPFGDTIALAGYDINPKQARAGDRVHVRLYWRLLNPSPAEMLRSSVHVTGRYGVTDYGGSNSFHIGAMPISRWTDQHYVTDDHFFTISPDAPPFQLEVHVSAFDDTMVYLLSADQQQSVAIDSVGLMGDWLTVETAELNGDAVRFGDKITLLGYHWQQEQDQSCVTLRWRVDGDDLPELAVMLHLLDSSETLLHAADTAPFNGQYPTHHWRTGQQLDDRYCFVVPDGTETLLVGLYDVGTFARLAPTGSDGVIFPHQALELTVDTFD